MYNLKTKPLCWNLLKRKINKERSSFGITNCLWDWDWMEVNWMIQGRSIALCMLRINGWSMWKITQYAKITVAKFARSCEHQVKITRYVEITPRKFEGFVNEVQRWQTVAITWATWVASLKFCEIARSWR